MTIEQQLKVLINQRYGTAKAFSEKIGMPNSTLDNIFRRGIANSSVTNIIKICNGLSISADGLAEGKIVDRNSLYLSEVIPTEHEADFIKKYRSLDQRGQEAVDNVLDHEYRAAVAAEDNLLSKQA